MFQLHKYKKNQGTWILLILTILVVAYAYFFEFKKRKSDEAEKEREALVLKVDKNQIVKIAFKHDKESFTLEKIKDAWRVTAPVEDDVDVVQVHALLDALTKEKADIEIGDDAMEPKIYGLDKPVAELDFWTSEGKQIHLAVGDEALQGKSYLRLDSSRDVIVSSSQWSFHGQKSLKDFRSKLIFRGGDINSIEVQSKKGKVLLATGENGWVLEGAKFKGDVAAIRAFVTQIQNLRATEVESEDQKNLAKYGLEKPAVVLRVAAKDNKDPVVIRVSSSKSVQTGKGNKSDSFVATNQLKPVYRVSGDLTVNFEKKPSDFRDREEPFRFSIAEVIGLRIHSASSDFRFIRKGESWYLERPDPDHDVDQAQLMSLLTSLQGAKVHEYLGQTNFDKMNFKNQKTIDLLDKEGNSLLKVEVGDDIKGKNQKLMRTSKVSEVFSVERSIVDSWPTSTLVKEKIKEEK